MPTNKPEYFLKYQKEKLERLPINLPKGSKDIIKAYCSKHGYSVQGLVKDMLAERIPELAEHLK